VVKYGKIVLSSEQASTELSSVSIGGQVVNVSDEFFAEAYQLLLVEVSASLSCRQSDSIRNRIAASELRQTVWTIWRAI